MPPKTAVAPTGCSEGALGSSSRARGAAVGGATGSQTPVSAFILYPGGHGSAGGSESGSGVPGSCDCVYCPTLGATILVVSVGITGVGCLPKGVVEVAEVVGTVGVV